MIVLCLIASAQITNFLKITNRSCSKITCINIIMMPHSTLVKEDMNFVMMSMAWDSS